MFIVAKCYQCLSSIKRQPVIRKGIFLLGFGFTLYLLLSHRDYDIARDFKNAQLVPNLLMAQTSRPKIKVIANLQEKKRICGFEKCHKPKPGMLNVHLVPHSHDDTGWVKTFDQYYNGIKMPGVTKGCVKCILTSVVKELVKDPKRKFIQVETSFFWTWWKEQSDEVKSRVKDLVTDGQLVFIGGGWSMNDEAACHYSGIIDNMALGLLELKQHFGECGRPKVGWQVDPFGHSKEQANLFAQMGFDGLFFARIDQRDKNQRIRQKKLQFVWDGTDHLGEESSIFTGIFADHYYAPRGFYFENTWASGQILTEANVEQRVDMFVKFAKSDANKFINNSHIMLTMGGDFTYGDASLNYKQLDMLIERTNANSEKSGVHLLYSTPYCYLKALHEGNSTYPNKEDDFFPYRNDPNAYWTGYFTSRPAFKYHERQANSLLQSSKQLDALLGSQKKSEIHVLQNALGISQHHDAITGTAKQFVDLDYHRRLRNGEHSVQKALANEVFQHHDLQLKEFDNFYCSMLNMSSCQISESKQNLLVLVHNPLSRKQTVRVRLPVTGLIKVFDNEKSQIEVDYAAIPDEVLNLRGRDSNAKVEALFEIENVRALGYKIIYVQQVPGHLPSKFFEDISLQDYQTEVESHFSVEMGYYESDKGSRRQSGAYIFVPSDNTPTMAHIMHVQRRKFKKVTEYLVKLEPQWLSFLVRKYGDQIEVEWQAGPLDTPGDNFGKEVIMKYRSTPLVKNNQSFWTDSNGRQMMHRKKNHRFSFEFRQQDIEEPVASNYYPVTTGMYLTDKDRQMSVLTDRSQGGTSLNEGEIELMVHRRLVRDDGWGVYEALTEQFHGRGLVVRGKHQIFVGNKDESSRKRRLQMQENYMQPMILLTKTKLSLEDWSSKKNSFSGLLNDLPENLHILTLEALEKNKILFRIEHPFEAHEHSELSKLASLDLHRVFASFEVIAIEEMTLAGNIPLSQETRLHWNTDMWKKNHGAEHKMRRNELDPSNIILRPLEIRTFLLDVMRNK